MAAPPGAEGSMVRPRDRFTTPSNDPLSLLMPFMSSPIAQDYRARVEQAQLRHTDSPVPSVPFQAATRSGTLRGGSQDNAGQLRAWVLATIKQRLQRNGHDTSGITERTFSWLLPKKNAATQDWELLIKSPILLSTSKLESMLALEQSTSSTPNPDKKAIFYIRTFAFTVEELSLVLQDLLDEHIESTSVYFLLGMIHKLQQDDNVFIRYVGYTKSGSAYHRHVRDLRDVKNGGFLNAFLQFTATEFPEIIEAAQVHELKDGTIYDMVNFHHSLTDQREQGAIALFDAPSLLNVQTGGRASAFEPTEEDEEGFHKLSTNLIEMFSTYDGCSPDVVGAITQYAQETQRYAMEHQSTTGTSHYPITDEVCEMIAQQAIPAMIKNMFTTLVTLGCDLTRETIESCRPFYAGRIVAAQVSCDILNQLASWEAGYYRSVKSLVPGLLEKNKLPFADIFQWLGKNVADRPAALAHIRSYMQIVCPLVIMTFSQKVSAAGVGSFQHFNGLHNKRFTQSIGQIFMSKYDDDASAHEDANCVLVVPCYHPGSVAYAGEAQIVLTRIIAKVFGIVWLASNHAAKLATEGRQTKKQLLTEVQKLVQMKTGAGTAYANDLEKLKLKYNELQRKPITAATRRRLPGLSPMSIVKAYRKRERAEQQAAQGDNTTASSAPFAISSTAARVKKPVTKKISQAGNNDPLSDFVVDDESEHESSSYRASDDEREVPASAANEDQGEVPASSAIKGQPEDVDIDLTEPEVEVLALDLGQEGMVTVMTSRNRWRAAQEELFSVVDCGVAVPFTERNQQIAHIHGLSLALLDTEATGYRNLPDFTKWANAVPIGELFYLAGTDTARRLEDIPNLMSLHLASDYDANDPAWIQDQQAVQGADAALVKWLKAKVVGQGKTLELIVARCILALTDLMQEKDPGLARRLRDEGRAYVKAESSDNGSYNGREVHIKPYRAGMKNTCMLDMAFHTPEHGDQVLKNFWLPSGVLPMDPRDKRYIWFLEGGIDIRDERGRTLGLSGKRTQTVPLTNIVAMLADKPQLSAAFLGLWERETSLAVDDVLHTDPTNEAGSVHIYPASWFHGEGTAFPTKSRKKKDDMYKEIKAALPIQPEDAAWVLHKLLLQHYPNKGDVIDTANPEELPDADSIWPKLQTFLRQPLYRNHPQKTNLIAVAEAARDKQRGRFANANLSQMLKVLRSSTTEQAKMTYFSKKAGEARMKGVSKTLITITGDIPADLLGSRCKNEPLELWNTGDGPAEEGFVDVDADAEDDEGEEAEMGGLDAAGSGAGSGAGDAGQSSGAGRIGYGYETVAGPSGSRQLHPMVPPDDPIASVDEMLLDTYEANLKDTYEAYLATQLGQAPVTGNEDQDGDEDVVQPDWKKNLKREHVSSEEEADDPNIDPEKRRRRLKQGKQRRLD